MNAQPQCIGPPERAAPGDGGCVAPLALDPLREALVDAQARRIHELERRLTERSRVLTDAAEALATEIRRREQAQAALFEAQKLEALGHLAGGLAHDLRNVLGAMGIGYRIIQQKSGDADTLKVADSGIRALDQAHRLIESLLNLMRRRDNQTEVIAPAVWLPEMEDLLGYAAGRHVSCRLQIAADVWPVRVEEHRLGAALINLAANARDAMPDGGEVVVTASNLPRGAPRPAAMRAGDFVVFAVTDAGCGMTPEVLARATDPLFSTKPPGQGTGLGLPMVQGFALAAAGYLSIASQPGKGTRVELYLPRSEDGPTPSQVPGADPEHMPQGSAAPAGTVMLVDDDDLIRTPIANILRDRGYRVVESSSAEVALALLHTVPRLALVVADPVLPGADGAELVQRLRLERPGLPALFIAGHALTDSPLPGVPLLTKPVTREQLEAAVQAELHKPRPPRDQQAELLDRLMVRLRAPALLAALQQWREARARGCAFLPTPEDLSGLPPTLADRTFIAAREDTAEGPAFRFLSVGPALTEQLGRPLDGAPIGAPEADLAGTLAAAYHRALRTGLPSYEYARYALGDGPPVLFERLILPVSLDGQQVSHLIGIVLFANLPPYTDAGTAR